MNTLQITGQYHLVIITLSIFHSVSIYIDKSISKFIRRRQYFITKKYCTCKITARRRCIQLLVKCSILSVSRRRITDNDTSARQESVLNRSQRGLRGTLAGRLGHSRYGRVLPPVDPRIGNTSELLAGRKRLFTNFTLAVLGATSRLCITNASLRFLRLLTSF